MMDEPKKQTYYQKNRERLLAKQREYNNEHMTQHLERNKKYYNKEYFRLYYHRKKESSTTEISVPEVHENIYINLCPNTNEST